MKEWIAKNRGMTIIFVVVVVVLLVAIVVGPSIWTAFLAAHGM